MLGLKKFNKSILKIIKKFIYHIKMIILIQENLYKEKHEARLIETLNRLDLEYYYFKYVPFTNELIFEEKFVYKKSKYLIFGAINSCRVFESKYQQFLNPGTFFNKSFDFKVYKDIWKKYLLNYDSLIQSFNSDIEDFPCFIRPTEDSKILNGSVFQTKEDWLYSRNSINHNSEKTITENIQISTIKNIYSEIRCFVVNKKVVTCSFYRLGNKHYLKECFDKDIIEFAQAMIDIWSPIKNFVIDIARTQNGLKIIEIGCINCAGFYDINLPLLIDELIK